LYNYPNRAAAEAVKGPSSIVVESLGRIWLFAITHQGWRPVGGERVAMIGPLTVSAGKRYTARYMEGVLPPAQYGHHGHRHPGPEAFYVLAGTTCVETPEGNIIARAGEAAAVPEGPPMSFNVIGTEMWRTVFVVLHDASQEWITDGGDWTPKGSCTK
jgi:quercetin dioxygenase-like cupin family protein